MSKKTGAQKNRPSPSKRNSSAPLLIGGIVLIAAAVLVMVWLALTPSRGDGGIPKLETSAERLELGKQIFDQPVRATFTIKNAGNGTLTLNAPGSATALEGC